MNLSIYTYNVALQKNKCRAMRYAGESVEWQEEGEIRRKERTQVRGEKHIT